jgi:hypothetical protein
MHRTQTALILLLAAGAMAGPPLVGAPDLPARVRTQLTAAYPGWRFARVDPRLRSELIAEPGRRRSPAWVSGDFNGDGRTDYAVQIGRPGPRDSTQLVLAFVAGLGGYRRFVLHSAGEHLGFYLRTSRRGERVLDLEKDLNGDSSFVLMHDAVDILSGEGTVTTCLYESGRWRCVTSGD